MKNTIHELTAEMLKMFVGFEGFKFKVKASKALKESECDEPEALCEYILCLL